jgi:CCR4-NOT transcription complex subunit 2
MPPRSVIQGGYVPGLQPNNHRTAAQQTQAQNIVQQPSPSFIQQRGQTGFSFGGGLGQSQQPAALQQHSSTPSQLSQLQQQQANGASNTQPLLTQNAPTPSLSGTAPSVSSASEVGLDPNDFPALGSAPSNINSTSAPSSGIGNGTTTSYASQAGTGILLGGAAGASAGAAGTTVGGLSSATGATGSTTQPRDFTPDDFPALGGHVHTQTQSQGQNASSHPPSLSQNQESHLHPPGLNGFQHADHSQQHRQTLLGSLGAGTVLPQGTPGMLNLGPTQVRSVHPGFQQGQAEAEKQQQRVSAAPPCSSYSLVHTLAQRLSCYRQFASDMNARTITH